ncbi:SPRY domain-containing protein [Hyphomonas sp.]|uniref:SPRY domain-containing protein n=1 Tax=Hyphomonas sp. TaxID=87 RepID=UPI000C9142D7|nr:SPRY domain-containing protein [Hyphomonas sp.]MAL42735.1 hypothetical protein [Hyphomonas sp.]
METLQRTANRGSISTAAAYEIDNSLKLERANSENIYRQIIDGNRRTWTSSLWVKRVDIETPSYNMFFNHGIYGVGTYLRFNNDDTLTAAIEFYGGGTSQVTNAVFRDTSAWMHIVWRVDTTQSTEANRSRIYINGAQITSFSSATYPSQNTETLANHDHGGYDDVEFGYKDAGLYSNMYYADVYHVDGQSLAPTEFGEYDSASGIWRPIEADISDFGNNGFYLDFSNASSLGTDSAGNGSFTLSNISSADQATDTPTNNFATLNPLMKYPSSQVINEGMTKVDRTSGSGLNKTFYATIPVFSGKFYFEAKPTEGSGQMIGVESITGVNTDAPDSVYVGEQSTAVGYYASNGNKYTSASGSSYGNSYGNSDIIGVALDMDNRKVYFAKNNTWQNSGDPTSGSTGTGAIDLPDSTDGYIFAVSYDSGGQWVVNFGGYTTMSISSSANDGEYGTFEYAPPTGYYALCTKNLAQYGG